MEIEKTTISTTLNSESRLGFLASSVNAHMLKIKMGPTDVTDHHSRPLELMTIDTSVIPKPLASRDSELKRIEEAFALATGSGARICILAGMGGAGKSTLARVYVKKEHDRCAYTFMVWIDAESEESIEHFLANILGKVYTQVRKDTRKDMIAAPNPIYQILKERTMLVFDNVDDITMVKRYLPKNAQSHIEILITTRKLHDWGNLSEHLVKIGTLERSACQAFIRSKLETSRVPILDIDYCWEDLAKHFGYLVIALDSGTSAIVEEARLQLTSSFTISQFLETIKSVDILQAENIDEHHPAEKAYKPLRQLWTSTLEKLEKQYLGELSLKILQCMALFSPSEVPKSWLSILFRGYKPRDVQLALNRLDAWSLVMVTKSQNLVIHRVLGETLLSKLISDTEGRAELYGWLLPAVQGLHSNLRRENKVDSFFVSLKVLLRCLEGEEECMSLVIPFIAYMHHRGDLKCSLYLRRIASQITSSPGTFDFEVLDQFILSKVQVGFLLPVYVEQAKKYQCSKLTLKKTCEALTDFGKLKTFGTFKVPQALTDLFETALEEHGTTEILAQLELCDLVNAVTTALRITSKYFDRSSCAGAGEQNLPQAIATTGALGDIVAQLVRCSDFPKQPGHAQFAVLKAMMWWNWAAKCVSEPATPLPLLPQDSLVARGLGSYQCLLRGEFGLHPSVVASFSRVISTSEGYYEEDEEEQIDFSGHILAAMIEILSPCGENLCKDIHCKVLASLLDFVDNCKKCCNQILPVLAIHAGIDAHVEMFESGKNKILLGAMKNRLERDFGVDKNEHYYHAIFLRLNKAPIFRRKLVDPNTMERRSSSIASTILEELELNEEKTIFTATNKFRSDVNTNGYNNETTFLRFENVLEAYNKDGGGSDAMLDFWESTVQAANSEFLAKVSQPHFACKCFHTNYQLSLAQRYRQSRQFHKAKRLAEEVLNHRLQCYKSNEIEGVVDLIIELGYETGTDQEQDLQDQICELLIKVVDAQDAYFTSSFYKREACYSTRRFIVFLCHIGLLDKAVEMSQKFVASLKGPSRFVVPTSCLIVLHSLLFRGGSDNHKKVLLLIEDWKPVFERDSSSDVILQVLRCIARRDAGCSITYDHMMPCTGTFASRPLVDACWSQHVLKWIPSSQKASSAKHLFNDKRWLNWITDTYRDKTIKLCCGKSHKPVDDVIFYYQTMEILLFGDKKQIIEALKETENKLKAPGGDGINYKYSDALTCGPTRMIVQQYRRGNLWFQQQKSCAVM